MLTVVWYNPVLFLLIERGIWSSYLEGVGDLLDRNNYPDCTLVSVAGKVLVLLLIRIRSPLLKLQT